MVSPQFNEKRTQLNLAKIRGHKLKKEIISRMHLLNQKGFTYEEIRTDIEKKYSVRLFADSSISHYLKKQKYDSKLDRIRNLLSFLEEICSNKKSRSIIQEIFFEPTKITDLAKRIELKTEFPHQAIEQIINKYNKTKFAPFQKFEITEDSPLLISKRRGRNIEKYLYFDLSKIYAEVKELFPVQSYSKDITTFINNPVFRLNFFQNALDGLDWVDEFIPERYAKHLYVSRTLKKQWSEFITTPDNLFQFISQEMSQERIFRLTGVFHLLNKKAQELDNIYRDVTQKSLLSNHKKIEKHLLKLTKFDFDSLPTSAINIIIKKFAEDGYEAMKVKIPTKSITKLYAEA
ncbi:MAG: hypothetical protein WCI04_02145 [archaeon]